MPAQPTRRAALGGALALAAGVHSSRAAEAPALKGNIHHSAVSWCFMSTGDKWDAETLCRTAKELGLTSVELFDPKHWPLLKKYGLTCAIASNSYPKAGFMYGLNNVKHNAHVVEVTKKQIDTCAEFGVKQVIAFVGYKWVNPEDSRSGEISREECFKQCVAKLKELAAYGEKKNVIISVEHLNTRDTTHPMKGHPGYQGDDLDFVAEILRKVGSSHVKLLFDIYHVQAMHGDVIRRLGEVKDILGHIHTAGNPGRGELDDKQEINYPAVMKKLVTMGYTGHVGHEFIPTRDARQGLTEAVKLCDV